MMRALGTACVALLLVGCGGTVGSGVRDEGAAALGDKAAVSPAAAAASTSIWFISLNLARRYATSRGSRGTCGQQPSPWSGNGAM